MNKLLRSTAAAVMSAVLMAGCTIPGTNARVGGKNEKTDSYSYSPTVTADSEEVYSWLIRPSVQADNIISFDASRIDPDNATSKMYINYSVIRDSGKYGLIDYAGNVVIKPEYDDYYVCSCGEIVLLNVIDERKHEYEYRTIDDKRQVTDIPAHTEADDPVYYWDTQSQKLFTGQKGDESVTEYTGKKTVAVTEANVELDDYGNYIVKVPEGALCGLAKEGSLIVDCQYDAYYAPAYKGVGSTLVAFLNASGKWGYLDHDGNTVIDFICDGDPNAYNGLLNDDQMLIHPYLFCDDYIPVYKDGYYSYYDFTGEQVVRSGEFAQARPINNGRAWVKQNDFWGVIQMGEIIEEERPVDEDSSIVTTTSTQWTQTTSETTESQPEYTDWTAVTDEYGNPVTTSADSTWTDPAYTDPAYTDPAYTEPVYTDPVNTQPVVTDPVVTDTGSPGIPSDFFEY